MNILLIDGNGKTGHVTKKIMENSGINIDNFDLNYENDIGTIQFDEIVKYILKNTPDYVINFSRVINQEAERKKLLAISVNSFFPHLLEYITKNMDTKIIHISTDCVFSGNNGPYIETDTKDGNSFYALTKSVGELENEKDLTIRVSIIGPDPNPQGTRLFNWFMNQNNEIFGYGKNMWNGVTSIELARILIQLIEYNTKGIVHIASKPISKLGLLEKFNEYFRNNSITITNSNEVISNKVLIDTKLSNKIFVKSYDDQMSEMKKWIEENKDLYKHYSNKGD